MQLNHHPADPRLRVSAPPPYAVRLQASGMEYAKAWGGGTIVGHSGWLSGRAWAIGINFSSGY